MTIRTFRGRLLINDDRLIFDDARLRVTFVTGDVSVPSLQGEVRPRIVIERGGNPALGGVTIRTGPLAGLRKLPRVGVFVTILTNL